MRAVDVAAAADALGDGIEYVAGMTRDVHRAVARRAFEATEAGVGPAVAPVRAAHDTIADAVHEGVRLSLSTVVRGVGRVVAASRPAEATSLADRPWGGAALAAVNGLWGDRLRVHDSELDLGLGLRLDGRDLPATAVSLARAYPDATGRVAVFVHGLMETERSWWRDVPAARPDDLPTHGDRLRRDLGFTPVWVRYNPGRRVSEIGRDLDRLVAALGEHWPVPMDEVALVGHSMGGLVARSAVAAGAARDARWVAVTRHVVCLGSPHHGAPLEKLTNATAWALRAAAEARPFASFLDSRSVGIKDLRYGNVSDEDWVDTDPDALLTDTRSEAAFVAGVAYHAIGARISTGPVGRLVGDALVRLPSATGRHRDRTLPFHRAVELDEPVHHLALLSHPSVYAHIRDALATWPPESAEAADA